MSARISDTNATLNEFRKEFLEFVGFVRDQFQGVHNQFERNQEQFTLLAQGQVEIQSEVHQLNRRVGKLEETIEDIRDEQKIMSKGLDEALEQLVNHEDRIESLEKKVVA